MTEVLSIGNCQSEQLARCLRLMLPGYAISHIRRQNDASLLGQIESAIGRKPIILLQRPIAAPSADIAALRNNFTVFDYPSIAYSGFHPDLIRPKVNKVGLRCPMGTNHSAIIMYGYLQGLDEATVTALFRTEVFEAIGYYSYNKVSIDALRDTLERYQLWSSDEFSYLQSLNCFMYTTIHPKLEVIAMLARSILKNAGIEPKLLYPEELMTDDLANNIVWPVYPEIGNKLGIYRTEYLFKAKNSPNHIYSLDEFVSGSFQAYRDSAFDDSCHPRFSDPTFLNIRRFLPRSKLHAVDNPYFGLPDFHFWRRSVSAVPPEQFDPIISTRLKLHADTKVATAGSCFAQHIARRLSATGHHYLVTEAGELLPPQDRSYRNYGVYSARYGNIYTVRQLVQLFRRAYGEFVPSDTAWQRPDGRFIDPFRPEIEPDGFATPDDVAISREEHFDAVRAMFAQVDVFVFTLGLTESWQSRHDGAVFPLCPAVVAGSSASTGYDFINFSYDEIVADLKEFLRLLRGVNPEAKLLLTVSPVPLVATYESRHVMVSTVASKSILRAAADEIVRLDHRVDYFPSYEIIANPFSTHCYYESDSRTVSSAGVDHVMRVFLAHYSDHSVDCASPEPAPINQIATELAEEQSVVCEEERLDPGRKVEPAAIG